MVWRIGGILLAGLLAWTVRNVPRSEWELLILTTGLLTFGMWGWIKWGPEGQSRGEILVWALGFRLVLWGEFPAWSDDVYRFYWDAWVALKGWSPYAFTPRSILVDVPLEAQYIFPQLNSPDYFSVYLPWHQRLFQVALGDGTTIQTFATHLQGIYLGIEMACWWIILKLSTSLWVEKWKWVIWNPLFLLEFIGNLHIEGLVVVFLILGWVVYLSTQKMWISILPYLFSVAWKWTPLLWVPLLWKAFPPKERWKALVAGGIGLPIFTWSIWSQIGQVGQSLDLYFQRFEFNASVYYLVREIGQWMLGYNPIATVGPVLSVMAVGGILYWAWFHRGPGLLRAYYSYGLYLALSTTVHPWYVLPWLAVGVMAGRSASWFGMWFLSWSYHAYSQPEQPIWAYAVLGCWVIGEEIIFSRTLKLPATREVSYLRKFFQCLSLNIPVARERRSD